MPAVSSAPTVTACACGASNYQTALDQQASPLSRRERGIFFACKSAKKLILDGASFLN
jgi:hypothetical protein